MADSAFVLFEPLFKKFDTATHTYVNDISTNMIASLTPVLMVALTLGFVIYALAIVRGAIDMPVNDFLWRCFRVGVIVSIATAGGLYQSQIADAIVSTPDALAAALLNDPATMSSSNILDATAGKGFQVASKAFENAGIFGDNGIVYAIFGAIALLATAVLLAIGGAFIILAKVALAVLAGLGPLFIFALLWQVTSRFFEMWTAQIMNYGLLILLVSTVFMLLMGIYGGFMDGIKFDGTQNAAYNLGGAVIISIAAVILLLQMPSIASGLAGGVGISYMWEMRMIRGGVGSFGKKGSDGQRTGAGGVLGATGSMARGGYAGARAAGRGISKIAGYARGKLAS
ncbi:type IV secretion system protein [Salmonella enterica]